MIDIGGIELIVRKCTVRSIQPVKAIATEIPPTVSSTKMQITHFSVLSDMLDGFCFLWCSFSVCVFCLESRTGGKTKVGINGVFSYEYSLFFVLLVRRNTIALQVVALFFPANGPFVLALIIHVDNIIR